MTNFREDLYITPLLNHETTGKPVAFWGSDSWTVFIRHGRWITAICFADRDDPRPALVDKVTGTESIEILGRKHHLVAYYLSKQHQLMIFHGKQLLNYSVPGKIYHVETLDGRKAKRLYYMLDKGYAFIY